MLGLYFFGRRHPFFVFFFFNDTATTEIYTLSLHDALPIFIAAGKRSNGIAVRPDGKVVFVSNGGEADRKSTRLNSSHGYISYAVFCLKKKKRKMKNNPRDTREFANSCHYVD